MTASAQSAESGSDPYANFKQLVEQIPAITYTETPDPTSHTGWKAIYMGPQMETKLGYRREEWIGDPNLWLKLLHPDDRERVIREDAASELEGRPFFSEYRLIARDGRVLWFRDEAVPISEQGSKMTLWQGVMLDITKEKEQAEALKDAQDALERADEERRRFIAGVVKAQEDERARIARDLSEDAIQLITALSLRFQAMRRPSPRPQSAEDLDRMAQAVDESLIRLRKLLFELLPPALERDGLAAGVQQYLDVTAAPGQNLWRVQDNLTREPPHRVRQIAYRIIQEAVKGAQAAGKSGIASVISLETRNQGVFISISVEAQRWKRSPLDVDTLAAMDQMAQVAGGWCRLRGVGGHVAQIWLPE